MTRSLLRANFFYDRFAQGVHALSATVGEDQGLAVHPLQSALEGDQRHPRRRPAIRAFAALRLSLAALALFGALTVAEAKPPKIRVNPNSQQSVDVTVVFANAPGPFEYIEGSALYSAENYLECGRVVRLAGTITRVSASQDVRLTKIAENTYRGTIIPDRLLDDNYYGRAVCHWQFTGFNVGFRANADEVNTSYVMSLSAEDIRAGRSDKHYYWKGYYPRARMEGYREFGDRSLDKAVSRQHGGEFFTVTVTPGKGSR